MRNLIKKMLDLYKEPKYKSIVNYIFFGVCTTLVNLVSFQILTKFCKLEDNLSNAIAIILSVLFAYITNKDMVFHSEAESIKEKFFEFFKFVLGRAFTMILEFGGGFIMFKLPIDKMISKLILTVVVIILNFFISKFFAFKKKSDKQ